MQQAAKKRLEEVELRILQLSEAADTAEDKDIPAILMKLQRARVSKLTLKEIVEDLADPTTYREMTLLNRMVTGRDPEEEAKARNAMEAEMEAEDRLANLGINPDTAGDLVRALNGLQSLMNRDDNAARDTERRDRANSHAR